ncbi:MAG: hypothetical protein V3W09_00975 [Nitrososphaerales archaeon]
MDEGSPPEDPDWITIAPGEEVVIAFAVDEEAMGGNDWMWDDYPPDCRQWWEPCPEVESVLIVMVYLLDGEMQAQSLPFQALVITP